MYRKLTLFAFFALLLLTNCSRKQSSPALSSNQGAFLGEAILSNESGASLDPSFAAALSGVLVGVGLLSTRPWDVGFGWGVMKGGGGEGG